MNVSMEPTSLTGYVVLIVLLPMLAVGSSMVISNKLQRDLQFRQPNARPYQWGYFIGCMCFWFAPATLGLSALCGWAIIKRRRWAWITVTILTLNPLGWFINGIYASHRWREFGEEQQAAAMAAKRGVVDRSRRFGFGILAVVFGVLASLFLVAAIRIIFFTQPTGDAIHLLIICIVIVPLFSLTTYLCAKEFKSTRSFGARNWKDAVLQADTIVAHEIPRMPQRDTRRSWRVMRRTMALLCAGVAAIAGYMGSDDPGNSKAEIAEFKSSVAGYINSIQLSANDPYTGVALNGPSPGSPDFELILNGSPMPAPVVWNADVSAAAARLAAAFKSLNERNQYFAQHDDNGKPDTTHPMHRLVITPSLTKRLGIAAVAAIGTWLAVWLLVVAIAFVWWFFIDRLRDIAGAVKGE
jgi:hypothetical protein